MRITGRRIPYHMRPCGLNDGLLTELDKLQIFGVQLQVHPAVQKRKSTSIFNIQDVQGETQLLCSKTFTTCLV